MTADHPQNAERPQRGGARRRAAARLAAVQALYQIEMSDIDADHVIDDFLAGDRPLTDSEDEGASALPPPEPDLFSAIVRGVVSQRPQLDGLIADSLSADWTVERLELLVRLIMEAGVWEIVSRADIPVKVSINEYVEVAHAFFEGAEPGMINAVLDAVAKSPVSPARPEKTAG